jgi:UDP-N-acetylmuramate--alanine ligase
MTATILCRAGLDPTVVVGGRAATMGGSNARVGRSEFLVVEADESDRSFLKLAPILAVVTNIDREHVDCYASIEDTRAAFVEFANRVPFYGAAVMCADDENVRRILPLVNRRVVTYGCCEDAELRATEVRCAAGESEFRLARRGEDLGRFRLRAPGGHNVRNATAAAAIALELEIAPEAIRAGLEEFVAVDRRFQLRGAAAGVTVVDDYGHHPTEIRATLDAARLGGYRRIHVLFQPHRYTRTAELIEEFARSFEKADTVLVLDIYAASEPPIPGVTAQALVERLARGGHRGAEYAGTMARAVKRAGELASEGDLVLTLGAGNVWQAGDALLARLREGG